MARLLSVTDAYANWTKARPFAWSVSKPILRTELHPGIGRVAKEIPKPEVKINVGIIGAGMSGLYAGLLLKKNSVPFHIFERSIDRVGGRVYTYREAFGPGAGDNQYFEAGAMRLPCFPFQDPIFELISYLNEVLVDNPDKHIELIDYIFGCEEGNLVYMNGNRMTLKYANEHPERLGFVNLKPEDEKKHAYSLMGEVMKPLHDEYQSIGPEAFFEKYDHMSLQYYLTNCARPKWYPAKINYVETMTSGTNDFSYGVVDSVIMYEHFTSLAAVKGKTIKNGMSRLPQACATLIGEENITMGAFVYKIDVVNNKVAVTYSTDGCVPSENPKVVMFDKVLITIPTPGLRMIERPLWSPTKEAAIRACNIQPCYKLGLQFETRFWENPEKVDHPTFGGQSTTDTPSRWIVYPSYGLGDKGKGVLLIYCWSADALNMLPASDEQRKNIALRDLQSLYPKVDIRKEFTGKWKSIHWTAESSSGVAHFLPGQFKQLYPALQEPEGPASEPENNFFYFSGEHISMWYRWIVGALDSAGNACKQMFPDIDFEVLGKKDKI